MRGPGKPFLILCETAGVIMLLGVSHPLFYFVSLGGFDEIANLIIASQIHERLLRLRVVELS